MNLSVADNLKTLVTLIAGVSELATSTGTSVGGQLPDPTVSSTPLPSAWVVYAGRAPTSTPKNGVVPKGTPAKNLFVVMVYLDNSSGQDNLIVHQIPILEKVVHAVTGQDSSQSPGAFRFSFEGERLASVNPKRLTYEMRFSIGSYL